MFWFVEIVVAWQENQPQLDLQGKRNGYFLDISYSYKLVGSYLCIVLIYPFVLVVYIASGTGSGPSGSDGATRDDPTAGNVHSSVSENVVAESGVGTSINPAAMQKIKEPKKKTSNVWNHYDEFFVEEKKGDKVIK